MKHALKETHDNMSVKNIEIYGFIYKNTTIIFEVIYFNCLKISCLYLNISSIHYIKLHDLLLKNAIYQRFV